MTIYTSFHGEASEFSEIWERNTLKHADKIVCVGTGKCNPYKTATFFSLNHNRGHIGTLLANGTGGLSGWGSHIATLAMLAYSSGEDFIFVEADCLIFGPIIERLYAELGSRQMLFGRQHEGSPWMSCSQSLFLVKQDFIPEFLSKYLSLPPDIELLTEDKFVVLEQCVPDKIGRFSFGYDRVRPVNYEDEVFYMQQIKPHEIEELKKRALI